MSICEQTHYDHKSVAMEKAKERAHTERPAYVNGASGAFWGSASDYFYPG